MGGARGGHDVNAGRGRRYVIYGAGAVGSTIGARLFESGRDVVLIARGAHFRALEERGLKYGDPDRTRVLEIPVVDGPDRIDWSDGDVVIVATKTHQAVSALDALVDVAPPEMRVVCAMNGLEADRMALRRFRNVYSMTVVLPATHVEPGAVDADSLPIVGVLDLGRYPSGTDELAESIAADLNDSGFESRADPDIVRWRRAKLIMNISTAINAMCGPDRTDRELDGRAVEEARRCLAAAGLGLPTPEEQDERWGGKLTMRPIEGRPRGAGSSWQSLARATGSIETDFLNGEIVLLGRLHGVDTPVNELVQRVAREMARDGSPPGSVSPEALRGRLG